MQWLPQQCPNPGLGPTGLTGRVSSKSKTIASSLKTQRVNHSSPQGLPQNPLFLFFFFSFLSPLFYLASAILQILKTCGSATQQPVAWTWRRKRFPSHQQDNRGLRSASCFSKTLHLLHLPLQAQAPPPTPQGSPCASPKPSPSPATLAPAALPSARPTLLWLPPSRSQILCLYPPTLHPAQFTAFITRYS